MLSNVVFNLSLISGTQRAVVVSSEKAIKDVLINKQEHFSDRPPSVRGQLLVGDNDIAFSNDSAMWRYKKKHLLRAIKLHGDTQKQLESLTLTNSLGMLQEMENNESKYLDPSNLFSKFIISNLMGLVYGYSTNESVAKIKEIAERVAKLMGPSGPAILIDICPSLRFLFPIIRTNYEKIQKAGRDAEQTFKSFTDLHKEKKETQNSKVSIDHFLDLLGQNSDDDIKLKEIDVIMVAVDIVMAGFDTTYYFLTNLVGILVNHPHIQDRAYQEIVKVIGKRTPNFEDRQKIPYMEALIMEALRYTSITPLSLPHYSCCDSEINGFFVPKDTIIFPNLWHLHHDEKFWDSPWDFDPSRFLTGNGEVIPPNHVPGRKLSRICYSILSL